MRFLLALPLMIACTVFAASTAKTLFGRGERDAEKIFGAPDGTTHLKSAGYYKAALYYDAGYSDGAGGKASMAIYYDRDYRIAAFVFTFTNDTNAGNDPKTGKPWGMPASFVNFALKVIDEPTRWQMESRQIVRNTAEKIIAEVRENKVTLTHY